MASRSWAPRSWASRSWLPAVAAVGLLAAVAAPAEAAPQVLGLVASAAPVHLSCDAGGCRAELSSFCLQQPRANPAPDTAYLPAADAEIYLVGTDLEGAAVRLPAAPFLRFSSSRGFTAVTAEVSAEDLRRLGLAEIALEIGPDVSLLPVAADDDPSPQMADEIAAATGAVRAAAEQFFDAPGEASDAIRATNAMINALPATGRSPSDSDGRLLGTAMTAQGAAADPSGIALAREIHGSCVTRVDVTHHVFSMRDCLEGSHDRLVVRTNIRFWESLGGS